MSQRILTHRGPNETLTQAVADIDELREVAISDVDDRIGIFVEEELVLYFYDYDSTEAEDYPVIIEPTAGVGRWKRHNATSESSSTSVGVKSVLLDSNLDFTYDGGSGLSTATLPDITASTVTLAGLKMLAKAGVLNMRRVSGLPANAGEFQMTSNKVEVFGDITADDDKYLAIYPVIVQTDGFRVLQEYHVAATFTYNGGSGLSSKTIGASASTDANLDGLKMLAKGGVLNMKRVSVAPASAGEWRVTGTTLEIYGDVTASGDTYLVVYPSPL